MKDALGKEINVGDTVAYPGRRGSSCWINIGVVTKFCEVDHPYRSDEKITELKIKKMAKEWGSGKSNQIVTVSQTDRIVKIEAPSVVIKCPHCGDYLVTNVNFATVMCPHCNTNCCSGTTGKNCPDDCQEAHEYQERAYTSGTEPTKEECESVIKAPDWERYEDETKN